MALFTSPKSARSGLMKIKITFNFILGKLFHHNSAFLWEKTKFIFCVQNLNWNKISIGAVFILLL